MSNSQNTFPNEELFLSNISLVDSIIKRFYNSFTSRDDLRQVGLMGLFQACKRYKGDKNVSFSTYATYYILGEIKKELRNNRLIKLSDDVFKIIKLLKKGLKLNDIEEMGYSKELIFMGLSYKDNPFSIDKTNTKLNYLNEYDYYNNHQSLIEKVKLLLDEDEYFIIKLKYIYNYSQKEIGQKLQKNQSQVSRLEKKIIDKLRKKLSLINDN